jgi:hypothetical protein
MFVGGNVWWKMERELIELAIVEVFFANRGA